jgi:hypothetical protein
MAKMPEHNVPFDRILLPTIEAYYAIGDTAKADAIAERLFTITEENLTWYTSLEPQFAAQLDNEMAIAHAVLGRLQATVSDSLGAVLAPRFQVMDAAYKAKQAELQQAGRRNSRLRI